MTTEQRERLLGQVLDGVNVWTACAVLGVTRAELRRTVRSDIAFKQSLRAALLYWRYFQMEIQARVK